MEEDAEDVGAEDGADVRSVRRHGGYEARFWA